MTTGTVQIDIKASNADANAKLDETKTKVAAVGDEAESTGTSGQSGFSKIGSAAKAAAKVVAATATAAVVALGTATVKMVKDSVEAYADYEQLIGGVETLFGADGAASVEEYAASVGASVSEVQDEYDALVASQDTVVANAEAAWKTCGMSANDYMETATSFAASLVSSLDGDTQAAADAADVAMQDMADNANKMGTDIDSITDAYKGFAKQNYTMLDNLKLGYGGTKTEMERLISDANELKEEMGETGDLSIDSYADVVEAIHLVQEEMGITGTTAEEAEETITGSINAMSAAWTNWQTALGSEDLDIGEYTENLIESIETVAGNLLPRIAEVVGTLFENLPEMLSGMGETLGPIVADALAGAWNLAADTLAQYTGIELPGIDGSEVLSGMQATFDGVSEFVGSIGTLLQPFVETLLTDVFPAIAEAVGVLGETLAPVVEWVESTVVPMLVEMAEAVMPIVVEVIDMVVDRVEMVGGILKVVWKVVKPILTALLTVALGVFLGICDAVEDVVKWFKKLMDKTEYTMKKVYSTVKRKIGSVVETVSGLPSRCVKALGNLATKLTSAGKDLIQGFIDGIKSKLEKVTEAVSGIADSAVSSIKDFLGIKSPSRVFAEIGGYLMEGLVQGIEDGTAAVVGKAAAVASDVVGAFGGLEAEVGFGALSVDSAGLSALASAATLQLMAPSSARDSGMVINQSFSTRVVRADSDLYTAAPILYRSALREASMA